MPSGPRVVAKGQGYYAGRIREIAIANGIPILERKPLAGMDMLTVLGRQFHASQQLIRIRASRNPNDMIDEEQTFGQRIADHVASFGGSWTFIITFLATLVAYVAVNVINGNLVYREKDIDIESYGADLEVRWDGE